MFTIHTDRIKDLAMSTLLARMMRGTHIEPSRHPMDNVQCTVTCYTPLLQQLWAEGKADLKAETSLAGIAFPTCKGEKDTTICYMYLGVVIYVKFLMQPTYRDSWCGLDVCVEKVFQFVHQVLSSHFSWCSITITAG